MIFSEAELAFNLIDVLRISDENIKRHNQGRHFSALSFRRSSDAEISFKNRTLQMQDGSVTYFPADLDYTRAAGHDDMIVIHFEVYNYSESNIESFIPQNPEKTGELFERVYEAWCAEGSERYYRASAAFYALFAHLHRQCSLTENAENRIVREAKRIMQSEFSDPGLTVKVLAEGLAVSQEYLRRVFRAQTGASPKKYLQELRLRRAAAYLAGGYYSVKETAEKCGFEDEKYFSVAFRKAVGCTPSAYGYNYTP